MGFAQACTDRYNQLSQQKIADLGMDEEWWHIEQIWAWTCSVNAICQKKVTGMDDSGLRQDRIPVLVIGGLQSNSKPGGERWTPGSGGDHVKKIGRCWDHVSREAMGRGDGKGLEKQCRGSSGRCHQTLAISARKIWEPRVCGAQGWVQGGETKAVANEHVFFRYKPIVKKGRKVTLVLCHV